MNLGMISNYVKAKWSKGLTEKKVEVNTKDIRLLSCFGNGDDITVCPGLRRPRFSASSITPIASLSLTEAMGLNDSTLA